MNMYATFYIDLLHNFSEKIVRYRFIHFKIMPRQFHIHVHSSVGMRASV